MQLSSKKESNPFSKGESRLHHMYRYISEIFFLTKKKKFTFINVFFSDQLFVLRSIHKVWRLPKQCEGRIRLLHPLRSWLVKGRSQRVLLHFKKVLISDTTCSGLLLSIWFPEYQKNVYEEQDFEAGSCIIIPFFWYIYSSQEADR